MNRLVILISFCLLCICSIAAKHGQITLGHNQLYAGGRIGIGVPTSLGRPADQISFKDVASIGFAAKADAMWMVSDVIGIGGELGFNKYPYKEQFWMSLNQRGTFDASYKDASFGAISRIFLGQKKLKPFWGLTIDGHYLINDLSFVYSKNEKDPIDYTYKKLKAGFGAELGIFFRVAPTTYLSVALRSNILPYLDEEIVVIQDQYTFEEKRIAVNPHGKQNNIEAVVGLHFLAKRNTKRTKH